MAAAPFGDGGADTGGPSTLTHPVIRGVGLCGVAYLASWVVAIVLGAGAGAMVVVAAVSATVVVLGAPAFALAVGVEQYFRGRVARISR